MHSVYLLRDNETVAGGKAIQVVFEDRTDTVLLQLKAEEVDVEGQPVTSSAALIVQWGGRSDLVDLAGK